MKARGKLFLTLATICIFVSVVVYFEMPNLGIFWSDLHSGDTLSMYEFAKHNLRQGNIFDGVKYLYLASMRAVEFRKHQRAVQPLGEEYSRLYQQGDYKNALIVCEKIRTVLNGYDDEGAMAYECVKTKEKLSNQTQSP